MGGVEAEHGMDRAGRVKLGPFRREGKVHQMPTDNNASSVKERRNLVAGIGGDGGGGRAGGHDHPRGRGRGRGKRERGARVLNLRKQETLDIRRASPTAEAGATGKPAACRNPVPPVLRELGQKGTRGRGRRRGETRGKGRGRGRGSGR